MGRILLLPFLLLLSFESSFSQVKVKKANRLYQVESRMEEKVEPGLFGREKKPVEYLRYDERGRAIERVQYNRSGDVSYRESREFDGKLITRKITYSARGKVALRRADYSYNENGLLVEERLFIRNRLRYIITYSYVEGLLSSERWVTPRNRFVKERIYTYTFRPDAEHELVQPPTDSE